MERSVNVTVVYYSSTGTIHRLATEMVETAEKHGAEVRLVRAAELAPATVVESRPAWKAHLLDTADVPIAAVDDVLWADAVILGTPTRFGNVSAQLKQFIDTLGPAWFSGLLANKVYSAFTSGGSTHGGMETTLVSIYNMVCHFGGIIVPPGGDFNPYGTSHVLGADNRPVCDVTLRAAGVQAERVVRVARALKEV
ncbi:NAD(P)H-dependent oxidoreductase [Lentzea sp. NPDC042327]|uniref:NAD(P)H-dependent oxidoreductase n=1 Tax=Lentzea sp. NPDC042327 TaxID=3154801 RepID=UPI0033C86499